jgi:protein tyrosine phosphatase (PTP) superfamily phosphohydrolase (DUF442 family)
MPRPPLVLLAFTALVCCGSPPADAAATTLPALGINQLRTPLPGIATSGQPTAEQFAALPAAGVRRVVNLRLADEPGTGWEEARAAELGMQFVRLPIAGTDGLTRANVARFAEVLAAGGDAATLVSCASSNRVGAMLALKAYWLDGSSADDALAIGQAAGLTKLEPPVRELLAAPR